MFNWREDIIKYIILDEYISYRGKTKILRIRKKQLKQEKSPVFFIKKPPYLLQYEDVFL